MRKLSEYRDEEALDLLADIMEPISNLFADGEFRKAFEDEKMIKAVSLAIKGHKADVMAVLARMEGVPVEEYHCSIATLPLRLIELMQDDALREVFTSQVGTSGTETSSSPA